LLVYLKIQTLWPEMSRSNELGKAFKSALLLDEMGQAAMGFFLMEPVQIIEAYLNVCKEKRTYPEPKQMEEILITTLMSGSEDMRRVAKQVFPRTKLDY
jgi:hypothetical protein